jgi:hypothetical protein
LGFAEKGGEQTMRALTHAYAFQVLLLQAADEGRGDILFGESLGRARTAAQPFMVGKEFPDVYLEFPLVGDPFLDVTILLAEIEPGTHVASEAADGTDAMLDWYAKVKLDHRNISCGYELDTKEADLAPAAVHFQPRNEVNLVRPFFQALGEPERADLYLGLAERMPEGWPLSFLGLFRGRPGSPLRACGYLSREERDACSLDPARIRSAFDTIGFAAHTDTMLEQASTLLAAAPGATDFQLDVYPDGTLGDTYAIDVQFGIQHPQAVMSSFADGECARVMRLLEDWGIADDRWPLGAQAAFARSIPVERDDGTLGRYAFTLMPQWVKVRWRKGALQPSKLYMLGHAGLL